MVWLRRVPFPDAALHRVVRPSALSLLTRAGLTKDGQQDNTATRRDVIGYADLLAAEVKSKLSEFAAQLPRIRFSKQYAALSKEVDVELDGTEVLICEAVQPCVHLRLGFDLAPRQHFCYIPSIAELSSAPACPLSVTNDAAVHWARRVVYGYEASPGLRENRVRVSNARRTTSSASRTKRTRGGALLLRPRSRSNRSLPLSTPPHKIHCNVDAPGGRVQSVPCSNFASIFA